MSLSRESSHIQIDKLTTENYESWKIDAEFLLLEKGLFGYIDGTEPTPAPTATESVVREHRIRNERARALLCLAVSPELKSVVLNTKTAKEVWDCLRDVFQPTTRARRARLRREFLALKLEVNEEMAVFLARVDSKVRDLKAINVDVSDLEVAYQYLDFLPDEYDTTVQQIYHWNDKDFTVKAVREQLLSEHNRQKLKGNDSANERGATGAFVTRSKSDSVRSKQVETRASTSKKTSSFHDTSPSTGGRRSVKCFECGGLGHIRNECPTAVKRGEVQGYKRTQDNTARRNSYRCGRNDKGKSAHSGGFYVSAVEDDFDGANLLNENLNASRPDINGTSKSRYEWFLDSGATDHVAYSREWFTEVRPVSGLQLTLGQGKSSIEGIGNVELLLNDDGHYRYVTLKDVLYVPQFAKNLISISRADLAKYHVQFHEDKAVIYRHNIEEWLLRGQMVNKLYQVVGVCSPNTEGPANMVAGKGQTKKTKSKGIDIGVWHSRFGHQNDNGIWRLSKSETVFGVDVKDDGVTKKCEACQIAKSTRASFPGINAIRSKQLLELLHMDLWGPSRIKSLGGASYLFTIVDDYSRFTWVFPLKSKDQAFETFVKFQARVERQCDSNIITVRSDNGMEFCSQRFEGYLRDKGVSFERTNPYSPEMNGVSERYNRTLIEGVRAIFVETTLPRYLWAELAVMFTYLKNRFPHSSLNYEVPYTRRFRKKVSLKHIRKPGAKAYVHFAKRGRDKLSGKAWEGVCIGYAMTTKGYRIWNPLTDQVVETKHVFIDENCLWSDGRAFSRRNEIHDIYREIMEEIDDYEREETDGNERREVEGLQDGCDDLKSIKIVDDTPKSSSSPLNFDRWRRTEIPRKNKTSRVADVYYFDENGKKFRSQEEIRRYCESLGVEDPPSFSFKPQGRHPPDPTSTSKQRDNTEGEQSEDGSNHEVYLCDAEPRTYEEAVSCADKAKWQSAMQDEIDSFTDRDVYEEVNIPDNTKILGCRWIYKLKRDVKGRIARYKARLVAQGFRQTYSIDYDEVFSPVVCYVLIRLFLCILVVLKGWRDVHIDVKCAYLYGNLDSTVYMQIPKGFQTPETENKVWCLKKALYGLHQSGRCWFTTLDDTLMELGFEKVPGFNCVYNYSHNAILVVYVDDIVLFAKSKDVELEVIKLLRQKFELIVLGPVQKLLGVQFDRDQGHIRMHQTPYIMQLAKEYRVDHMCDVRVPIPAGTVVQKSEDDLVDFPYRNLVGSLLFVATRTRPDVLFSVILLSQYNTGYTQFHVNLLLGVLRYIVSTKELSIDLSLVTNHRIYVHTDASWANDRDSRKSFGGHVIFIDGVPISWSCKKQSVVALSTMEAEFMSIVEAAKDVHWLCRGLDYGVLRHVHQSPVIYTDSLSAMHFSKNLVENNRSKHIDIKLHFLRDWLARGFVDLQHVSTKSNVADLFTKWLTHNRLRTLRSKMFWNGDTK